MVELVGFWQRKSVQTQVQLLIAYALVLLGAIVLMIPLAWMISTSLKPLGEVFIQPIRWIPSEPQWKNYPDAIQVINFGLYTRNSTYVTVVSVIGELLASSMAAFAFARLRAPGRNIWFVLLLSTLMLPTHVTLVSRYLIFNWLGWIDSYKPLLVPSFAGAAFYIFLLRQFMMTIPKDLDDAALIDGCGPIRLYWSIILPLCVPALAAVTIFSFFANWNAFLLPLIYLNDANKYTIPIGLRFFLGIAQDLTQWHYLMAGSLMAMLPCLLIFFFFQKSFVQGAVLTGLKG